MTICFMASRTATAPTSRQQRIQLLLRLPQSLPSKLPGTGIPLTQTLHILCRQEAPGRVIHERSKRGNLLNRTLGLLKKNCDATITADSISIPEDNSIRVLAIKSVNKAAIHYSELDCSSACEIILGIASAGNLYMNAKAPWAPFKEGGSAAEDAAQHLTVILEAVRIVAVALSPVVPEFCS